MKNVYIAGATRLIGEHQGYSPLILREGLVNCTVNGPDTPCMTTEWEPSPEERKAISLGAPVQICILGRSHPPLVVGVGDVAP